MSYPRSRSSPARSCRPAPRCRKAGRKPGRVPARVIAYDEKDPVERLQKISREMAGVKERSRAMPANLMGDWAKLPAPSLMAPAARLYENFGIQDYHTPAFNLVISNVPGPPVPLYYAGAKVLANHPISIPFHGAAFNITLMSYCGKLDFGLIADRDAMPDISHFRQLMHSALDTLH